MSYLVFLGLQALIRLNSLKSVCFSLIPAFARFPFAFLVLLAVFFLFCFATLEATQREFLNKIATPFPV